MFFTGERQSPYDNKLPEEEKEKVKSVLFIMNKFSVSLRAYSGLAQEFKELPLPYLVEGHQKEIDKDWSEQMTRTPGTHPGAELPFKELLSHEIAKHVSSVL